MLLLIYLNSIHHEFDIVIRRNIFGTNWLPSKYESYVELTRAAYNYAIDEYFITTEIYLYTAVNKKGTILTLLQYANKLNWYFRVIGWFWGWAIYISFSYILCEWSILVCRVCNKYE